MLPRVLELKDVTLFIGSGDDVRPLLSDINASFPRGHFGAIIGSSGCGKSTLLKVITGIAPGDEEGTIFWNGRNVTEEDFSPSEIGYVPQFSIAHEELTVRECVGYAMRLRVRGMHASALEEAVEGILEEVGMAEVHNQLVSVLSGGQKRRLALAMELVSKPAMLLCDEVTSGLDPQSEDEIVRLLHGLSRTEGRVVLSVTHSLRHLELYDSVLVLHEGVVAYHGPSQFLTHYFRTEDARDLYSQLGRRSTKEWAQSWKKHRHAFLETRGGLDMVSPVSFDSAAPKEEEPIESPTHETIPSSTLPVPGPISQFFTLLSRRLKIFFRAKAQLALQLGLIFGFPVLVAIFAWNGLPAVKNLSMGLGLDVVQQLVEAKEFLIQSSKVGSLVSGIVMFQVVLLTLMGANNSGREIASERLIFEKEKLSGLSPLSYVAGKAVFLGFLVLAQSLWMGLFVHYVCGFPGELGPQLVFLTLVNAAMTSVCLAVSSFLNSAEQASLVSIYLVGFQLPLSGAVLALPDFLGSLVRPFIAAYWSWSGVLQTLKGERYYDIVQMVVQTALSPASLCVWVLCSHVIIGLFAAWVGCQHRSLK
ncbi:MAG: ATP-binding cassette domain-containing protein [Verrucomicrobiaceae bacterium]|nr:MAG: ATP-binding cassette domain-containing protein [Verrucomicrobiaceae bacterium]